MGLEPPGMAFGGEKTPLKWLSVFSLSLWSFACSSDREGSPGRCCLHEMHHIPVPSSPSPSPHPFPCSLIPLPIPTSSIPVPTSPMRRAALPPHPCVLWMLWV